MNDEPMTSALGKYAAIATTLVVVLAFLAAIVTRLGAPFGLVQDDFLDTLAFASFTYLLGQTAVVNGWKQPLQAAHKRMDAAGLPPAGEPTGQANG